MAEELVSVTGVNDGKNYGIRLASPAEGRKVFQSMAVMADYVAANRTK